MFGFTYDIFSDQKKNAKTENNRSITFALLMKSKKPENVYTKKSHWLMAHIRDNLVDIAQEFP